MIATLWVPLALCPLVLLNTFNANCVDSAVAGITQPGTLVSQESHLLPLPIV